MTRVRRPLLLALLVMVAAGSAWLVWAVYRAPDRTDLATYWQLVVAVVALLVALVPLVVATRSRPTTKTGDIEDEVLGRLAEAVGAQWREAAAERGLQHPEPVAVRWSVDPGLGGPAAAAVASHAFSIGKHAHFDLVGLEATDDPDQVVAMLTVSGGGFNGTGPMTFMFRNGQIARLVISPT
jgi:hypothetical protein